MTNPVVIGDCTLYLGDCADVLPTLPVMDLLLTDPPFGVGNFVQATGHSRGRGKNYAKPVTWNNSTPSDDVMMMLKASAKHRVIWGANFFNCFEPEGGAIVWVKKQSMPNFSKADIASCTHFKKTEIVEIVWNNFEALRLAQTDHPCERPVSLYEWCIDYMPTSKSILDPFMGSGSVAIAAIRRNKKFVGVEKNPEYFEVICSRVELEYKQERLFDEMPNAAAYHQSDLL